jgi:DNA-binding transcriptional regulator YdaS (Cro superfamily)
MDITPTPYEALQRAVEATGSQVAFGRICDVSQAAVWKWLQSSKRLPAEYVLRVEAATGISRHWLRPDIYPHDCPPAPSARFHGVDGWSSGKSGKVSPRAFPRLGARA